MKKTVYLVLALSLLLCSCSQKTDNDDISKVNDSSTVVTTAPATMTTTTTSSSKVDENAEISAYYIHHWYGEEPYEITDKDTIDKITAWIENAKSVCKDYPYIDGAEYGGADAYDISLEKVEPGEIHENLCIIDVSQYSWDSSSDQHSLNKICNFSIKDDTGEFQDYNLPKEMIDEIMSLITRPNVE